MEKVENPTAIRAKNSFSIENILSRPDNVENRRNLIRPHDFQSSHVMFYESPVNHCDMTAEEGLESGKRMKTAESEMASEGTDNEDHETNSEAASDDGNSSVHSEWKKMRKFEYLVPR